MTTPFPQAVLDQAARDAAANAPKNLLNQWVNKIKTMGGNPPAPAPTSSAAQVARDAKAGGDAMRNYAASQGAGNGMGLMKNAGGLSTALSVGATIGTNMRDTMPQSTFVSGRGGGSRALNNPRKNTPDPEYSTNPVKPSQPEGEETVYSPIEPRIERKPGPWDEGYVKPNTTMDVIPEAAAEPEKRAGDVAFVPDSTLNNGRDNSRTNGNGIVQKGTDMSRSFNDLLATTNTSGYQPFGSNQLPTTAGSPDSKVSPKTQQILAGIQAGKETDMGIDGYKGPAYTAIQPDSPQFAEAFGQDLADKYKSAADSKVTGYTKGGRLDQALDGVKNEVEMTPERRQQMAKMAFLNAKDSMSGLQARDAVNDVVYAGGQHYGRGELSEDAGIGDKYKIDRADARDIASGNQTAAGLLESYKSRITESTKETPAEAQDPLTPAASAVKDGFAAGAKTDFALNNNNAGTNKPGQKTIDSDFMESVDFSDPTQLAEYERRMNQLK